MVKTDVALVAVVFPLHLSHLVRGSNTGPQYLGSNYKQAINSHNSVLSGVYAKTNMHINEPPHGKTNNLHMRKQRRRSASR